MTNNSTHPFNFEYALKAIKPIVTDEQWETLTTWRAMLNNCKSNLMTANDLGIVDEAELKKDIQSFLSHESTTKNTLASIFLKIPDPTTMPKRWDKGRSRKQAAQHEKSITELQQFINTEHEDIKNIISSNAPIRSVLKNDNLDNYKPTRYNDDTGTVHFKKISNILVDDSDHESDLF